MQRSHQLNFVLPSRPEEPKNEVHKIENRKESADSQENRSSGLCIKFFTKSGNFLTC